MEKRDELGVEASEEGSRSGCAGNGTLNAVSGVVKVDLDGLTCKKE